MKNIIVFIPAICATLISFAQQTVNYNDVAVVVNDNNPTSVDIGNYFQQQRNIPVQNIIHITSTDNEEIDSIEFELIRQQIENYLTSNNLTDSFNYIVTTKGVPLSVQRGNCDSFPAFTKCSSFDTELALILGTLSSYITENGGIANPFYNSSTHFSRSSFGIYLVTRLDGYSKNNVFNLIDRSGPSIPVNKLTSNSIFDISYVTEPTTLNLFSSIAKQPYDSLVAKGWNATFHPDTPLLTNRQNVLGYYSVNYLPSGKTLNNTWVKGSICELPISFSAGTFDTAANINDDLLIADLIREGATGANGYVSFSLLSEALKPNILFNKYTDTSANFNLAESYYMSLPKLSWQSVTIGDPKTSIIIDNSNSTDDINNECSITIFPNPNSGYFTFQIDRNYFSNNTVSLSVFNTLGQPVRQQRGIAAETRITISGLPKGIYMQKVTSKNEITYLKIVVE